MTDAELKPLAEKISGVPVASQMQATQAILGMVPQADRPRLLQLAIAGGADPTLVNSGAQFFLRSTAPSLGYLWFVGVGLLGYWLWKRSRA